MNRSSPTSVTLFAVLPWIVTSAVLDVPQGAALDSPSLLLLQEEPAPSKPQGFGQPPAFLTAPLSEETREALELVFVAHLLDPSWGPEVEAALEQIASTGDVRLGWILSDGMRLVRRRDLMAKLCPVGTALMGIELDPTNPWKRVTDHLIAWDVPAPPGYLNLKREIFALIDDGWSPLFVDGDLDWRHVSWGGVTIDSRPFGKTDEPCNCIPAADNPRTTSAKDAEWLSENAIVFGIAVNGEYRAYPRQIMEVREMVNDTLGGRDLGIPYCTLCGSAQAYFTDEMPEGVERPVLRTSGLLIRSNKVMFDVNTFSVFDTFLGQAKTGPLAEKGIVLEQASVVTTTWGEWKAAHPETTVLAEELALGRDFDFRNGRDADGPIFPIGDVDPRLAAHDEVLGVLSPSGTPVAFPNEEALATLRRGETVEFDGCTLTMTGGGLRAVDENGADLGSHLAFWFAWSQFHPETRLWRPE